MTNSYLPIAMVGSNICSYLNVIVDRARIVRNRLEQQEAELLDEQVGRLLVTA